MLQKTKIHVLETSANAKHVSWKNDRSWHILKSHLPHQDLNLSGHTQLYFKVNSDKTALSSKHTYFWSFKTLTQLFWLMKGSFEINSEAWTKLELSKTFWEKKQVKNCKPVIVLRTHCWQLVSYHLAKICWFQVLSSSIQKTSARCILHLY